MKGLHVGAGVIDSGETPPLRLANAFTVLTLHDADYRGPVGIVMFNHTDQPFKVRKGDKLAQLILEKIITPNVVVVTQLDSTQRGAGGFGSSDRKPS
jgi:deoxyuridine 5'-triphosphate nucleotidohydrolase